MAKEEEKRRREQEDLEDEMRVRRELELANGAGHVSDYNRTRPVPKAQLEPDNAATQPHHNVKNNLGVKQQQSPRQAAPHLYQQSQVLPNDTAGMLNAANVVHRQESDVVVEYVPGNEIMTHNVNNRQGPSTASNLASSRYGNFTYDRVTICILFKVFSSCFGIFSIY